MPPVGKSRLKNKNTMPIVVISGCSTSTTPKPYRYSRARENNRNKTAARAEQGAKENACANEPETAILVKLQKAASLCGVEAINQPHVENNVKSLSRRTRGRKR